MNYNNDIFRKLILFTVYLLVTYIIVEQIVNLTRFIYKYNNNLDYGRMLMKICGNENFEYETSRFQLAKNVLDYKNDYNNKYNKKNYILFILIISILITVIISSTFSVIFFNNFIGTSDDCSPFKPKDTATKDLGSFKQIILCFCPFCGDLTDCTLNYIVYIIVLFLIPVVIILNWIFNIEFNYFNSKFQWYFIAFFIVLGVFRLPISYLDNFRYSNKKNSIIIYYLFLVAYIFIIPFILHIITEYNNYQEEFKYNQTDELDEPYDEDYIFYKRYTEKINQNDKDLFNIFSDYLVNVLGLRYFNINPVKLFTEVSENHDHFSRYVLYIGIFILSLYVIYLFIYKFKIFPSLIIEDSDSMLFYNRLIIPAFSLFILLLICNTFTYYNSYINKYIIYEPLKLYKNDLMHFYRAFDKIIDKDDMPLTDPKPVQPRVAGCILTELYNSSFRYNVLNPDFTDLNGNSVLINKIDLKCDGDGDASMSFSTEPDKPEDNNPFRYDNYDDPTGSGVSITTVNYDIKACIGTDYENSIFVKNNAVDDDSLSGFIANLYPIFSSIDEEKFNYKITEKNYQEFANQLKLNIKAAICNMYVRGLNYNGTETKNTGNQFVFRLNGYKSKNTKQIGKRTYIAIKSDDGASWIDGNRGNDFTLYEKGEKLNEENKFKTEVDKNKIIIDNVVNEYMMFVRRIVDLTNNMLSDIERCGSCSNNINLFDRLNTLLVEASNQRVVEIKNKYTKKMYNALVDSYHQINILLTYNRTERDKFPLTRYIISNYNSIKENEYYSSDRFIEIKLSEDLSSELKTTEEVYLNRLDDESTLEKNAKTVKQNAETVSSGIYLVFTIIMFILLEPLYIES